MICQNGTPGSDRPDRLKRVDNPKFSTNLTVEAVCMLTYLHTDTYDVSYILTYTIQKMFMYTVLNFFVMKLNEIVCNNVHNEMITQGRGKI